MKWRRYFSLGTMPRRDQKAQREREIHAKVDLQDPGI